MAVPLPTTRMALDAMTLDDAPFILELVNQPSFLRYIGDKNVRDLDGARTYLRNGPLAMYEQHGLGLWRVRRLSDNAALGMCGLIRRPGLDDVDIGFAFLPQYWGQGYALEAARSALAHARDVLRLPRLVAVTSLDNDSSIRLCEKLGMRWQRRVRLTPQGDELNLYAIDFA